MSVSFPMITAAGAGKLDDVREQLQKGACINDVDDASATALMRASDRGQKAIVVELLKHDNLNLNLRDKDGWTALMFAIWEGHTEIVVELMKHETLDLNLQDEDGDTALMLAASAGRVDNVAVLLKDIHLDVNRQNKNGKTATDLAKYKGHREIVKCLEDHAQAQIRSHRGEAKNLEATKLHDRVGSLITAAGAGKLNDVRALLQKGACINDVDDACATALMRASDRGQKAIVVELLKHDNLNLNLHDKDGWTALMFAIWEGHTEIVVELMKHETLDLNLQDEDGDTALMLAASAGRVDNVAVLLKDIHLDVNRQNKNGKTATDLAKYKGHREIVKCLEDHAQAQIRSHRGEAKNLEATKLHDRVGSLITAAGAGMLDDDVREPCRLL